MKNAKRLVSMLLAIAVMFSLAVPVMAEEHTNHVITIATNENGHTFEAYEIFDGEVQTSTGEDPVLVNVKWGAGIDWDNPVGGKTLLEALQSSSLNPHYYSKYTSIAGVDGTRTEDDVAKDIAAALANTSTAEHGLAFAKLAGKYLTTEQGTSKKYKSGADVADDVTDFDEYRISPLTDGYYLVKEADATEFDGETATLYMMSLVDNATVYLKAGKVTVTNQVLEVNGNNYNALDFYIGDIILFEAAGKVPERFNQYDSFSMSFVISFGDKFYYEDSYNSEITAEVVGGGTTKTVTPTSKSYDSGNNTLTVSFDNIKALGATVLADYTLEVKYPAKLMDNAVPGNHGGNGNEVSVHIVYTRDPYTNDTETTVEAEASVFTYQLDLFKKNGKVTGNEGLADAEFVIYRGDSSSPLFAKGTKSTDANGNNVLTINEWVSGENNATKVTSPSNGHIIFKGLDNAIYHLRETAAPNTFNKLEEDVRVNVQAVINQDNRTVASISVNQGGGASVDGDADKGTVNTTVVNQPGQTLPSTGGIGTTIFYVVGGILVAGAAVLLITRKRMEQ